MIRVPARLVAACIGLLFLVSGLPASADDGAAALLAKHKAFVGFEMGDGTVRSLRYEQTMTSPKDGLYETGQVAKLGLAYRAIWTRKRGAVTEDGFTGRIFWQSNENGFTHPTVGDPQKYAVARDILHNEATTLLAGTLHGTGTVDGAAYPIVRVNTPGDAIDLYVDPETGAYKRAVIDPGGDNETTFDILAYQEVLPGKKIISKYKVHDSDYIQERSKFVVNTPMTPDDLHPPKQTATWTFANSQPFPVKITDKRIILDAKVNGVPGRFILDTGADGIYLTDKFANRAQVKQVDSGTTSGIAGSEKTLIRQADTVEIGGNTLANVRVTSVNEEMDQDAPDGALGFDLLAGAIVNLSTDAQRMTITNPAAGIPDTSIGVPTIVDLSGGVPIVPMKLNGAIDVNATLDSGDFYYVLFSPDLINHHGLRMLIDPSAIGYLQSHVVIGGAGGYEVDGCGHLDALEFGPIHYQGPPACTSGSFSGRDTLVGYDFMRNFDYVFDYPESKIIFIPHRP